MMPEFIQADWPAPENVRACSTQRQSTQRQSGHSLAPFDSLNLAYHVNDDESAVLLNRQLLKDSLALPAEPCWLNQTHGTDVIEINSNKMDCDADGSYTFKTKTVCVVMTADCLPVLLCDKEGSVVAAVHAGWRGLLNGIIKVAVNKLNKPPTNLLAWLGPAIGQPSFEVGDEVKNAFLASDSDAGRAFIPSPEGRWLADLYQLAELQLNKLGIHGVYGKKWCTYKDEEHFFSYRRDGVTGRMANLIWLTES